MPRLTEEQQRRIDVAREALEKKIVVELIKYKKIFLDLAVKHKDLFHTEVSDCKRLLWLVTIQNDDDDDRDFRLFITYLNDDYAEALAENFSKGLTKLNQLNWNTDTFIPSQYRDADTRLFICEHESRLQRHEQIRKLDAKRSEIKQQIRILEEQVDGINREIQKLSW